MCFLLDAGQERIKDLTDKFNSELEADRQKFDMLLQEKNEQEVEYEEKLRQVRQQGGRMPYQGKDIGKALVRNILWCVEVPTACTLRQRHRPVTAIQVLCTVALSADVH